MIVSLYGDHLGPETACTAGPDVAGMAYPAELCGTRVMFGDRAAELLYVQHNQINLRIPAETPVGVSAEVRVVVQGRSSPPAPVMISQRRRLRALDDASAVTEALWGVVQSARWETSFDDWRQQKPDSECQEFEGTGAPRADARWSHHCTSNGEFRKIEWSFYAWDPAAPASRLGQLHAVVEGIAERAVLRVYDELGELLAKRHGIADDPGRVHARGAGSWRKVRRWRFDAGEIYLYVAKPIFQPMHVGMLVRTKSLLDALAEDPILWAAEEAEQLKLGGELDRELAQELEPPYPGVGGLLQQAAPAAAAAPQVQPVYAMALRLLEDADAAQRERRAAMLLAANRLAGRLNHVFIPPPDPSRQPAEVAEMRKRLAGFGVVYEWGGYDAFGNSDHLLWRLWQDYGDTPWGEWAFLTLHLRGWTPGVGCGDGDGDQNFREVIARGEAFLASHPASRHRLDVMFSTGEAYETWWSLSHASLERDGFDGASLLEGAEKARARAIQLYREILAAEPKTPQGLYARRELPRLELAADTGQRRFFCVIH